MKKFLLLLFLVLIPSTACAIDLIMGTAGPDLIFGDLEDFHGNSTIDSGRVWQELNSLGNADLLELGERLEEHIEDLRDTADHIFGLDGNDVIFGQGEADQIDGGGGEDIIFSGSGNDIIVFDPADRFIHGGSGTDILVAATDSPGLADLLESGKVQAIEAMFHSCAWLAGQDIPGLSVEAGKVVADPAVWKLSHHDSKITSYVSRPDGKMFLEILSSSVKQ